MKEEELESIVLNLLETGIYKTTSQVVEEFRMEYPSVWRCLEAEGERLYGRSCSAVQEPFVRISRVLLSLSSEQRVVSLHNKQYYWSRL